MSRYFLILFIVTMCLYKPISASDSLTWEIYAPVTKHISSGLYSVKTYFFNANPTQKDRFSQEALQQQHDSLSRITIGQVVHSDITAQGTSVADNWFWWPVKEGDKTYLLSYIVGNPANSSAEASYYELTFRDGTKMKWEEPHSTPYNFNTCFVLVSGSVDVMDEKNEHSVVMADSKLQGKFMTTPLYVLTKYNGYKNDSGTIEYYADLQYVFSEEEGNTLLQSFQSMSSSYGNNVAVSMK